MKTGDLGTCSDCGVLGLIVCMTESDFDQELAKRTAVPLEPSVYEPTGLTCRGCETRRFKGVLPVRGVCAHCGKPNPRAIKDDLGTTRSFCDDKCITSFLNARQHGG